MTWVRIDEGFPEHPKVLSAGGDAAWLFVAGLCYCNRNLTDGFIPEAALPRLSPSRKAAALAAILVDVRLWESDVGGWVVHDFLHYQPSRAEVEESDARRYSAKAEAGRLGGLASGVARRKHKQSNDEAEGEANPKQIEARPDPTRPVLTYISDDDDSADTPATSSSVEQIIQTAATAIALKDRESPGRGYIAGIAKNLRTEKTGTVNECIAQGLSLRKAAVRIGGDPWFVDKALNGSTP